MRILIGAFGTRGDVQPMIALSQRLIQRGHIVDLCTPPNFEEWTRKLGVAVHPVGMDIEKFIAAHGENIIGALPTIRQEIHKQIRGMEPFAKGADLFLSAGICPAAPLFAEKYAKPGRFVLFSPSLIRSDEYPAALVPWQRMPKALNRISWGIDSILWNLALRRPLNQVRQGLGLRKVQDFWASIFGEHVIIATEPTLAAPSETCPVKFDQPGAWFFDDPLPLSSEVETFLQAGPKPVFIGFGSMTDSNREQTMKRLIEATRLAGVRAIIARGWAGFEFSGHRTDVLLVGPTPHALLFPRCAAVIHHGGAGTMHQVMRAGVPQIPAPHLLDQFFWSEQLHRAGLSPGKISRKRLEPQRLAKLIRACIGEPTIQTRCQKFASGMITNGIDRTVSMIENLGFSSNMKPLASPSEK